MRFLRFVAAGLAAGVMALAAGAAQAGVLEIVYWGTGALEWVQVDGVSYTVDDDTVTIKDIYDGSHSVSFGANGTSRSFDLHLTGSNAAKAGAWCMALELDTHELLDDYDCEDMWDYYYF
jgi:hypothetical protein